MTTRKTRPTKPKSSQLGKATRVTLRSSMDREDLTEDLAQDIVIRTTPHPGPVKGQDQPLKDFGVLDGTAASIHAGRIQGELGGVGWHIKRADIETGATVTVADCTVSVIANAF